MRKAYIALVGKPQGMRPFAIPTRMWACNIKRILKKENDVVDWIYLAHDRDKF